MRLNHHERRQEGACATIPITPEYLRWPRKVPLLPSFGVQARDDTSLKKQNRQPCKPPYSHRFGIIKVCAHSPIQS
jgi:hypothetical protein